MKKTIIAAVVLTVASGVATAGSVRTAPPASGLQAKLLYPTAGTERRAGDNITIVWEVTGLVKGMDLSWCEQEVFLSTNGIQRRLTPEMDANVRKFAWTVPNTPSDDAFIVLRFGCQGGSGPRETRYPQMESSFRIVPANGAAARLDVATPALAEVNGQEGLSVSWKATADFASYEVLASFDRGVSFQSLGTTDGSSLSFKAPAGTTPLVRVVGVREDGTRHLSEMVRADVAAAD